MYGSIIAVNIGGYIMFLDWLFGKKTPEQPKKSVDTDKIKSVISSLMKNEILIEADDGDTSPDGSRIGGEPLCSEGLRVALL